MEFFRLLFDFDRLLAEYEHYVYPGIFVWTFLEGETFVIFAGYAAFLEKLSFWLIVLFAWSGSFLGDQAYFFLGRRFGQRLLARRPKWQLRAQIALDLLHRYNTGFILSFRFIYGIRNVSSFACGLSELHWLRFFVLNLIAAGLWAISFAGIGYVFGHALATLLPQVGKYIGLAVLAGFLVVVWLLMRRHKRRRDAEVARVAAGPLSRPASGAE
ncbi:MAG: DedA family protein [Alphaproteobacteria bacterium]|nr:DedA family protein [Alphaproteobacteria bacterium]